MAVETDIERAAMVSSDEFAVVARFHPADGGPHSDIECIFDSPYQRAELGFAAVATTSPKLTTLESWVDAAGAGNRNDEVEVPVGGTRYRVTQPRRADGFIHLDLEDA